MSTAAAAAIATKVATTWIGSELSQWIKDRKADIAEQRIWTEITNKVLKQTKTTSERYARISTVAFPRELVHLEEIYVPLTLESHDRTTLALIDRFPTELLASNKKTLVVDVAGMGKSTLSKIIFLRSLDERQHLPILIDLRRLDGSEEIEACLLNQFGLKQKHFDLFTEFLSTQPLLFLFDGFDEVSETKKLDVARTIRNFVDRSEKATFIMTSRPELPFSDYTDFSSFHIKELTKEQAFSLVRNYGAAYGIPDRAKSLIEELQAKHDAPVDSFLKNPLLTSLLFRAFEYKSVIPVKRGVFYRQVFDALYESHDLNKETGYVREKKTGLHHDDFHRAVRAVAKLFRERRVVEVDTDTFLAMARRVSRELCPDLAFPPEALLHDLLHTVPLFQRDGNLIRWAHKSLLDYFLCEFLLRDFAESREDALSAASGHKARMNENFLVLAHEADPVLFAKAISLPAIDWLLKRHQHIASLLPKHMTRELAADIANFFMCYEVVTSPGDDGGAQLWVDGPPHSPVDSNTHSLQLLYNFGGDAGSLGVYAHVAALSLQVPMMAGTVPHIRGQSIFLNYPRTNPTTDLSAPPEPTGFATSRPSPRDWMHIEEEFSMLMGLLQHSDLRFPTREILDISKRELESLVATSIRARSNNLF